MRATAATLADCPETVHTLSTVLTLPMSEVQAYPVGDFEGADLGTHVEDGLVIGLSLAQKSQLS